MNVTKKYFGNQVLFVAFCIYCDQVSIICKKDGTFNCCGRKAPLETIEKVLRKRICETFSNRKKPPKNIQKKIFHHQNNQCIYCGVNLKRKGIKIEFDHFVPFVSSNNDEGQVASCRNCNRIKSDNWFNSILEAQAFIRHVREKKGLINYDYFGGSYQVKKI